MGEPQPPPSQADILAIAEAIERSSAPSPQLEQRLSALLRRAPWLIWHQDTRDVFEDGFDVPWLQSIDAAATLVRAGSTWSLSGRQTQKNRLPPWIAKVGETIAKAEVASCGATPSMALTVAALRYSAPAVHARQDLSAEQHEASWLLSMRFGAEEQQRTAQEHEREASRALAGRSLLGSHASLDFELAEKLLRWWVERGEPRLHLATIYQLGPYALRDSRTARRIVEILADRGHVRQLPDGTEVDGKARRDAWELVP